MRVCKQTGFAARTKANAHDCDGLILVSPRRKATSPGTRYTQQTVECEPDKCAFTPWYRPHIRIGSAHGRGDGFSGAVPPAQPGQTPASAAPEPAFDALRGRRVLVIDNDDQVLDSTARLLAGWGCRVRALKAAPHTADVDSATPDLLLVDFQLDDGDDGLAVVKRLRVALHQPVPALIMTGDVSALTRQRIADSGLPMLEKPVSGLRLRTVMTRLLQRA